MGCAAAPRRRRHHCGCRSQPRIPAEEQTLSKAAAELVKPAHALEQAVLRRRAATADAKAKLAEFNDALNAVKLAAEALLQ